MSASRLIAIVDDDEEIRGSLSFMFESGGFTVDCFASAEAFRSAAGRPSPDLLLTDLHMPGMNGLELARALRAKDAELPIILLTAYATPAVRNLANRCGVIAVVEKPFQPAALLNLVRSITT